MTKKIISIAPQKGGTGKSTLTLQLSHCFSNGLNVAICDTDLQGSLLSLGIMADGIQVINMPEDTTELKNLSYDLILIDTPPYLSNILPQIFELSDYVLVPTKAGFFDCLAIRSTLALIENAMKIRPDLKAGIVFNMVKNNSNIATEIRVLANDFTIPVLNTTITDRVSYTRSVISGGIFKTNDEKAKNEITTLADEILIQLGI